MSDRQIFDLQRENELLQKLANRDELTGLYNRRAIEEKIGKAMMLDGALFVGDLDSFKQINDKYGHLCGDVCLQKTAHLLEEVVRTGDYVGRIGGDEFVIYATGHQTEETVDVIRRKIYERFAAYSEYAEIPLKITVGAAVLIPGESYEELFDRADQQLLDLKQGKGRNAEKNGGPDDWERDMLMIRADLSEQIRMPSGSYCQSMDTFKVIYRYVERGMRRSHKKASILLLSIADEEGRNASPQEKIYLMEQLGKVLQNGMRMGDVYTRYSSCQYLVLLGDSSAEQAKEIAIRLRRIFLEMCGLDGKEKILCYSCYELESAKIMAHE